jgi:hypothetical protein
MQKRRLSAAAGTKLYGVTSGDAPVLTVNNGLLPSASQGANAPRGMTTGPNQTVVNPEASSLSAEEQPMISGKVGELQSPVPSILRSRPQHGIVGRELLPDSNGNESSYEKAGVSSSNLPEDYDLKFQLLEDKLKKKKEINPVNYDTRKMKLMAEYEIELRVEKSRIEEASTAKRELLSKEYVSSVKYRDTTMDSSFSSSIFAGEQLRAGIRRSSRYSRCSGASWNQVY